MRILQESVAKKMQVDVFRGSSAFCEEGCGALPLCCAEDGREFWVEARHAVARCAGVERGAARAVCGDCFLCEFVCKGEVAGFHEIGDGIHEVVDVVPIVVG